jgi:hypothetical protein
LLDGFDASKVVVASKVGFLPQKPFQILIQLPSREAFDFLSRSDCYLVNGYYPSGRNDRAENHAAVNLQGAKLKSWIG